MFEYDFEDDEPCIFFLSTYFTNKLISALNYNRFVRKIGDWIEKKKWSHDRSHIIRIHTRWRIDKQALYDADN